MTGATAGWGAAMTTVDKTPDPTPGYASPLTYDESVRLYNGVPHARPVTKRPGRGTPPGFKRAAVIAFNKVQSHYAPGHPKHTEFATIDGPAAELRLIARIAADERAMRLPTKKRI